MRHWASRGLTTKCVWGSRSRFENALHRDGLYALYKRCFKHHWAYTVTVRGRLRLTSGPTSVLTSRARTYPESGIDEASIPAHHEPNVVYVYAIRLNEFTHYTTLQLWSSSPQLWRRAPVMTKRCYLPSACLQHRAG
jgi:hypothetical protein